MTRTTTIGKHLVRQSLPEDLRDDNRELDKKGMNALLAELAEKHPDKYVDVLKKLMDISRTAVTERGRDASFDIKHLRAPAKAVQFRKALRTEIKAVQQDPNLTLEQKNAQIIGIMKGVTDSVQKMVVDEGVSENNPFALSVKKGFRGNPAQLTQMLFGDLLVADHKGRAIPIPGLHGYGDGVKPSEYWASAYGSRKGYSDVQFATARAGFLGKQLAQLAQRMRVTGEDCDTTNGMRMKGSDPEILGYTLAQPMAGIPAGTTLEQKHLKKIAGRDPIVRSVTTCRQKEGICQKCTGQRQQGQFPEVGDFVGISAARVVAEPFLQMALSSKHTGGMVGVNDDTIEGFEEVNQFVQVPKYFKGAAALATADGRVGAIQRAPQGGKYITIGNTQAHIPAGREVLVKKGDKVWAGDILSSGTPNPAEIAKHKGIGAARQYFTNTYYDILKRNGVASDRRNIELLARSFYDQVEVTDPDGMGEYNVGDRVAYNELQSRYTPRDKSQKRSLGRAKGMYLEEPVMHYTIGTRITPEVSDAMKKRKVAAVLVHDKAPRFQPVVTRAMGVAAKDPDFKTRLGGFDLKRSLIDSATKGSTSPKKSTSPTSFLMNPQQDI